jgi:hypothetical protein
VTGRRLRSLVGALALCVVTLAPATASAQDMHVLLVTGVAGDLDHTTLFHTWAAGIVDSLEKSGLPDANIAYLADQPEQDRRIKARSTRENVTRALGDIAARARPGDDVCVLLIGHGSFDGREAAFNLPGPDMTAADFGPLLDKLSAERVTLVNMASSSGPFVDVLKKSGRVVIAATKTGGERNEPVFAKYFAEGLASDDADRDRNGRVSILEAFEYAQTKVKADYDQGGHIQTEHAVLEDGGQGKLAATVFLAPDKANAAIAQTADPQLRALLEQQRELNRQIAVLRLKKDGMDAAAYDRELEKLLTDLALKAKDIRDREAAR